MQRRTTRILIRAIAISIGLAALPIVFPSINSDADKTSIFDLNTACAQAGGNCVWEIGEICNGSRVNYNHYNQW